MATKRTGLVAAGVALALAAAAAAGVYRIPAAEATAGAPGAGDSYFPLDGNGGFDIGHYDLGIDYDPATRHGQGRRVQGRAGQDPGNPRLLQREVRPVPVPRRRRHHRRCARLPVGDTDPSAAARTAQGRGPRARVGTPVVRQRGDPEAVEGRSRGALFLHALRRTVGDEALLTTMRTWVQSHRYGNATTRDFQATAEQVSGRNPTDLVKAWVYTPSQPPYTPKP